MAREEIKLVGSFKDDITPKLQKLNREITNIGRSFERFNKKISPVTKNFAKMAMSAKEFSAAMGTQRTAIENSARAMREYSKQAGKMSGAMRKVTEARMKSQRQMGMSRAQARKGGAAPMGAPMPGVAPKGAGAAIGKSAGTSFMQNVQSTAIGNMIAQGFAVGAQKLKGLLMAPFNKFASAFAERIGDEMDDIKSAGGLFALDMDLTQESGNERFFKNYNEALRFQEKLNIDMAESAASLPGVTSQYVSTSRQLTDTIQMVMEKDREGFNTLAQSYGADVSMGGVDASKSALQTVLKKQTEQVMLQSQGQVGGLPMHIAIQQLLGKEAKNGKIGMQAFTNKFRAAFQKNPLLKNFLLRAEDEMAKTAAGSADRLKVIMDTFDAAMPKEVINKMRGSISGMQEAIRSGFLDPQAGLFGLSRANIDPKTGQKIVKKNVNDFGDILYKFTEDAFAETDKMQDVLKKLGIEKGPQETIKGLEFTRDQLIEMGYSLNKAGNIVKQGTDEVYGEISTSSTYIFEQIREILAGYGPVLLEFVGFLPLLFDPFANMTNSLISARDSAQAFVLTFNKKIDVIDDIALKFAQMKDPQKQGLGSMLKGQARARAALSTVAETLHGMGGIDTALFERVQKITGDLSEKGIKAYDKGAVNDLIGPLLNSLINSDLAKEFGRIGGLIIGGITKAVVDMIAMLSGAAKGGMANKLTEGFGEGIKEAFGDMSFSDAKKIIGDAVGAVLIKSIDVLFTQIIPPIIEMYIGSLFTGLLTSLASGNIIGIILSTLGIVKLGAMIVGIFTGLGTIITFVGGIFSTLAGIVTFVTANFALLSGIVGTVITAVVAPILAVVGAVMGLVAIFRHLDFITSSVVEGFKLIVNTFVFFDAKIKEALYTLTSSLFSAAAGLVEKFKFLGLGGAARNLRSGANEAKQAATEQGARASGASSAMQGNLDKIAANTTASFEKTAADADMLAKKFGLTGKASTAMGDVFRNAATTTEAASEQVNSALVGSATSAGNAITGAAAGLAKALGSAAQSIASAASAAKSSSAGVGGDSAGGAYDGHQGGRGMKTMPLGAAIEKEKSMMPSGADLVIANSSETIIPAYNGNMGDGFKGFSFAQLESAAGFDRMASYTEQISEIADKTAESFSMGGLLGGGSATLNAMEALGHKFGLQTTSGFRPGDPGFHGVNRARDLSNGGGETPEMNKVAGIMSNKFGQSLTELIYTPLGYSIKNGQKTGLISPDNHYHHIHVAVAEGLAKAAAFSSQREAEMYERANMPAGASPMKVDLSSMTANSSEFVKGGGGEVNVGGITVNVSGTDNPKEIANMVAEELMTAIQDATYREIFTN